jgi:hypothetical protein
MKQTGKKATVVFWPRHWNLLGETEESNEQPVTIAGILTVN